MISRRQFLRTSATAVASLAVSGFALGSASARANSSIHCLIDTTEDQAEYVGIYLPTREINFSRIDYARFLSVSSAFSAGMDNSDCPIDAGSSFDGLAVPYSVIEPDTRRRIYETDTYPYCATCFMHMDWGGDGYVGTAAFSSQSMALTAAHNVFNLSQGGFASSVEVYPGRSDPLIPYGPYSVDSIYIPIEYYRTGNQNYDYAALGFIPLYGKTVGYLGFHSNADLDLDQSFRIDGYPGDDAKRKYQMWGSAGHIEQPAVNKKRWIYEIDTSPGMSGTPIVTFAGATYPNRIVGVHTRGVGGMLDYPDKNSGVAIDYRTALFLKSFRVHGEK